MFKLMVTVIMVYGKGDHEPIRFIKNKSDQNLEKWPC